MADLARKVDVVEALVLARDAAEEERRHIIEELWQLKENYANTAGAGIEQALLAIDEAILLVEARGRC